MSQNGVQQVPLLINGEWVISESKHKLAVTNPANQQWLAEVPCASVEEIDRAGNKNDYFALELR